MKESILKESTEILNLANFIRQERCEGRPGGTSGTWPGFFRGAWNFGNSTLCLYKDEKIL